MLSLLYCVKVHSDVSGGRERRGQAGRGGEKRGEERQGQRQRSQRYKNKLIIRKHGGHHNQGPALEMKMPIFHTGP